MPKQMMKAVRIHDYGPRGNIHKEVALEFGLDRLRQEWNALQAGDTRETERARASVERIFLHIEEGFARAATRH